MNMEIVMAESKTTHSRERHEGSSIIPNPDYAVWTEKAAVALAAIKAFRETT